MLRLTFTADRTIRADRLVTDSLPYIRRTALAKLFRQKDVKLAGKPIASEAKIPAGEEIAVYLPDPRRHFRVLTGCEIIFEDRDVVAFDKRAGVTVQPGTGTHGATLLEAAEKLLDIENPILVHRLDRDTSGVIVIAKHPGVARQLEAAFRQRTAEKTYFALVRGTPPVGAGRIALALKRVGEKMKVAKDGQPAETAWQLIEKRADGTSLLAVFPKTGRTHQIRVHLAAFGYPVVGDKVYGREQVGKGARPTAERHLLHAQKLKILNYTFEAPLPLDFAATM